MLNPYTTQMLMAMRQRALLAEAERTRLTRTLSSRHLGLARRLVPLAGSLLAFRGQWHGRRGPVECATCA